MATVKIFIEEPRMHPQPTQEPTDPTLLAKVRYLEVHLPSNTTTKACSTMRACPSMDHMGTGAMEVDSQLFETCQPGGILGSRTRPSSPNKEMQALRKISDRHEVWSKWRSGLFPGFLGRFGIMGTRAAVTSATITKSLLNIVSIDPAQSRRTHRMLNIDFPSLSRDSVELLLHICQTRLFFYRVCCSNDWTCT